MQSFSTQAIILRRTNYGEADRILSLITPDRGKLSAIAKGVRKSKSKLAGGLELFASSEVSITEGKSNMGVITAARLIRFYGKILHDYDRMQFGYQLIKTVSHAAETVAEPEFYYLLRDSFTYLDEPIIDYRLVELWFHLRLTAILGLALNLATAADSQPLSVAERYNFDFTDMVFVAHPTGRFSAQHIKLLRLANAKTPAVLRHISGIDIFLEDCLWLLRAID